MVLGNSQCRDDLLIVGQGSTLLAIDAGVVVGGGIFPSSTISLFSLSQRVGALQTDLEGPLH